MDLSNPRSVDAVAVLHVHQFGAPAGETLLAVHGITAHGRRFRRLGDEGWPDRRTLAVDLRGHGRSTYDGPWNVGQHVTDLIDTLDSLEIGTTDVLGHSFGGVIALALLARAPERIRRLVLLDPAFLIPAADADQAAFSAIDDPGFGSVAEAVAWRVGDNPSIADAVEVEIADHLTRTEDGRYRFRFHRPAVVAGWGEMVAPLPTLTATRRCLLVIAGRAEFVTPEVQSGLATRFGDDLSITTIDAGHITYWERFEETADTVRRFLA